MWEIVIILIIVVVGGFTFFIFMDKSPDELSIGGIDLKGIPGSAEIKAIIPTVQVNGLIDRIVVLGQPEEPEPIEGTINQSMLDEKDLLCKNSGSLYYNVTSERCEEIPVNATTTFKDNLIFTGQGTNAGQESAYDGTAFVSTSIKTDQIVIPNPVFIRGFLVIDDGFGGMIEDFFSYSITITCEGLIDFCNHNISNEWFRKGLTNSNGYYEKIFRPTEGTDKPGEYVATIVGLSETRNEDGSRAEVTAQYVFKLI